MFATLWALPKVEFSTFSIQVSFCIFVYIYFVGGICPQVVFRVFLAIMF